MALLGRRAGHEPSACACAASRACVCVGYADGRVQLVPSHPVLHAGDVLERALPLPPQPPAPQRTSTRQRAPQEPTPVEGRHSPAPSPFGSTVSSPAAAAGEALSRRNRRTQSVTDADGEVEAEAEVGAEGVLATETAQEATQTRARAQEGLLASRVRVRGALRLGDGPVSALRFLFDDSFVLAALHNSRSLFLLRVHDT